MKFRIGDRVLFAPTGKLRSDLLWNEAWVRRLDKEATVVGFYADSIELLFPFNEFSCYVTEEYIRPSKLPIAEWEI